MSINPIEINSKRILLMKPVTGARYNEKIVMTKSAWEFVELWLCRQKGNRAKEALLFWKQAKNFYNASECLPVESKPLTSYYCCMNAAKALLAINGPVTLSLDNISHGITSDRSQWVGNNIKDAEVIFAGGGVLCELSRYFSESVVKEIYNVYDLLYNIPCVHRAFSITYNTTELFIPVKNVCFIADSDIKKGWVQFQVDERYAKSTSLLYAPSCYEKVIYNKDGKCLMRSKKRFDWNGDLKIGLEELANYQSKIRKDLHYIYGTTRLWYLKKEITTNKHIIKRNSITLIYAVMHWLSELVRYNPKSFEELMESKQNWLIHEFVENALYHFVDEISCEITKVDIMTTGYRR